MAHSLFSRERAPITLRDYQVQSVEDLRREMLQGYRRLLLQAGTGSGKTVIASEIIKRAVAKRSNVLFLAHRRELIDQCSDKLEWFGCDHGIIMAGRRRDQIARVQVASIQTLWSRAIQREVMGLPDTQLIVLDECHRSLAKTYRKIIEAYPDAYVLGLTATPVRSDGRGLGQMYERMVRTPGVAELTRRGYLVPVKYYAPSKPDLAGVKMRMGDYVEKDLERKLDKPPLIGNLVENWGRLAENRQTVVFASGVKHSIHIAEEFQRAGVPAAHLDGETPLDERADILQQLYDGDLRVVSNCQVLTEGWDCPPVSCGVLARPTKSIGLYLQMAGRMLRPWEGKEDTLLIDHSGAVYDHGFVDQDIPWTLNEGEKIQDRQRKKKLKESKALTCPECQGVFYSKPACPYCGWEPKKQGEEYHWVEGNLVLVTPEGPKDLPYTMEIKRSWWRQLKQLAIQRGYKNGWAAHTYKKKFEVWPASSWKQDRPEHPGPEVLGFVRHLMIKYAKRKANES
jgi:superfamily II DNA or RNA helicase